MSLGTYSTAGGLGVNQPVPTSASTVCAPFVHQAKTVGVRCRRIPIARRRRVSFHQTIPVSRICQQPLGTAFNSA